MIATTSSSTPVQSYATQDLQTAKKQQPISSLDKRCHGSVQDHTVQVCSAVAAAGSQNCCTTTANTTSANSSSQTPQTNPPTSTREDYDSSATVRPIVIWHSRQTLLFPRSPRPLFFFISIYLCLSFLCFSPYITIFFFFFFFVFCFFVFGFFILRTRHSYTLLFFVVIICYLPLMIFWGCVGAWDRRLKFTPPRTTREPDDSPRIPPTTPLKI